MLKYTQSDLDRILQAVREGKDISDLDSLLNNPSGRLPAPLDVIDAVASALGCKVDDVSKPSRVRKFVTPRQMASYFSYYYTRESLKLIGLDLGAWAHSTVISHKNVIESQMMYKDTKISHDSVLGELRSRGFKIEKIDREAGTPHIYRYVKGHPSSNPYGRKGKPNKPKVWSEP